MASGEWVSDYVQARERNEVSDLGASELAQLHAPKFFDSLISKVASDVRAFNSYRGNGQIIFQILSRVPDGEFVKWTGFFVAQRERHPYIGLTVTLRDAVIDYEYMVSKEKNHREMARGTFTIFADLQGRVRTIRDGRPYCDVSEMSEFLLRPVFDCVDFGTLGW